MSRIEHRRDRRWWRSRRLIAAIVIVDLLGAAALALALTRRGDHGTESVRPGDAALTLNHTLASSFQDRMRPAAATKPKRRTRKARRRPQPRQIRASVASSATGSSTAARTSFERFAASQPGAVGFAIAPLGDGQVTTFGALQTGHAWSTMKVPVLATVLAELEQRGAVLGHVGREYAARALQASDNSAAQALFARLEQTHGGLVGASTALQSTLRAAGDQDTIINTAPSSSGFTTWGQTRWSATGEVVFYRTLARGCILSSADTAYVLGLIRNVESDQRWGAGSAGLPAPPAFKGGWGPEDGAGYLVRQSAIVGSGNRGYVISMLARPVNGAFSTGTEMLTRIAAWAGRTFSIGPPSADGGC